MFQSTLPRGERQAPAGKAIQLKGFQSTLPRGERRHRAHLENRSDGFQSTLPRGERLLLLNPLIFLLILLIMSEACIFWIDLFCLSKSKFSNLLITKHNINSANLLAIS